MRYKSFTIKYDFNDCDDVCTNVKDEMNDDVAETDLKVTVVHVLDNVIDEVIKKVKDAIEIVFDEEAAFDVATAFDVKADLNVTASLIDELLNNVSMLWITDNKSFSANDVGEANLI